MTQQQEDEAISEYKSLKANMSIKPFSEVMIGDQGTDYGDEKGIVIAKGRYKDLKEYDSTGACQELRDDPEYKHQLQEMVAIVDEFGDNLLYVYGADGFSVPA